MLSTTFARGVGLGAGLILTLILVLCSIIFGVVDTQFQTLVDAYTDYDGSHEHMIIKEVRVPRALVGASVGASLGMAGILLQALTRNPLADTGILGINNGASLCIVLAVSFLSISTLNQYIWVAFAGAGISFAIVYFLGTLGFQSLSPIRLTLAGAAMAALCSSFTHAVLILDNGALQEVLFWLAGSVEGRSLDMLMQVLPFFAVAWIAALLLSPSINTLLLGDDVAVGLGMKTGWVKVGMAVLIVLLAGGAVAIAGPIAFVGLVTPHLARYLVGIDVRWTIVYAAWIGACIILVSDLAARFVAMPSEVPLGVMTAIIGTPFFVAAVRKGAFRE